MFAIGNDELAQKKEAGSTAPCPKCKKRHKIKFGTSSGKVCKLLGFITCGKEFYLANEKEL